MRAVDHSSSRKPIADVILRHVVLRHRPVGIRRCSQLRRHRSDRRPFQCGARRPLPWARMAWQRRQSTGRGHARMGGHLTLDHHMAGTRHHGSTEKSRGPTPAQGCAALPHGAAWPCVVTYGRSTRCSKNARMACTVRGVARMQSACICIIDMTTCQERGAAR